MWKIFDKRITSVNCSYLLQITTPPWFTGNNYYLLPQIEDLVLEESFPTSIKRDQSMLLGMSTYTSMDVGKSIHTCRDVHTLQ